MLLVQRDKEPDKGLWGFPGGRVEWGETATQAALRELHEETGLRAEALDYLTNVDLIRDDTHYLLAATLCMYVSGTPVAAHDAMDAKWVPLDTVAKGDLLMSARVADLLALAQARLAELDKNTSADTK